MASSSPILEELLNPHERKQTLSSLSSNQVAKIQQVPPYLGERPDFNKYYSPKVVSIGPIHHPKGEDYKKFWAAKYLDKIGQENAQKLVKGIRSKIEELKHLYAKDAIKGWEDDKLVEIFYVDGCATLHVMDSVALRSESSSSKLQAQNLFARHDLFLLENQLPYELLRILSNEDDSALEQLINRFLDDALHVAPPQSQVNNNDRYPVHLLDLVITSIVRADNTKSRDKAQKKKPPTQTTVQEHAVDVDNTKENVNPSREEPKKKTSSTVGVWVHSLWEGGCVKKKETPPMQNGLPIFTYRNVQELVTAGIKFKGSDGKNLTSIYFDCGTLYIPRLIVDDFTAHTFMNMMAYEMCPDNTKTKYEINNYICLLTSLIDHPDDVKELRKAKVINNLLGSDEDVANIFNTVFSDLVLDTGIYNKVRQDIGELYNYKPRTWIYELQRKHFNTPWKIIGLIALLIGFLNTVVGLTKQFSPKKA